MTANTTKKHFHVGGNRKSGFHLIIPREAYLLGGQTKAYTCYYNGDGTLIYQPVKP